jgi:cyclase
MIRRLITWLSASICFLVIAWMGYTQNPAQPPKLTLNKITDDLYEIEGDGGNVAVYLTSEGVILVDDKYDRDHDAIAAHIKSITDQPVKYVLSTHYHEDHSGGNAKYLPTAEIISTANARTNIVKHVSAQ